MIEIDDLEPDNIFRQALNFPEKLHKEFCRTVQSYWAHLFSGGLDTESEEPLGALIGYQNSVVFSISKEAKQGILAIEQELSKLTAKPLRLRQDANALREGAESYLFLREIATSGLKFSWDRMLQELVLRHLAD